MHPSLSCCCATLESILFPPTLCCNCWSHCLLSGMKTLPSWEATASKEAICDLEWEKTGLRFLFSCPITCFLFLFRSTDENKQTNNNPNKSQTKSNKYNHPWPVWPWVIFLSWYHSARNNDTVETAAPSCVYLNFHYFILSYHLLLSY